MIRKISKNEIRERVHIRIRKKLRGTTERPRLTVFRSTAHIYAQVIDDIKGVTLVAASSTEKAVTGETTGKKPTGGNLTAAKEIGKRVAERAKENGINKVVFDRGGYIYHGRVKALADAAREAGLEF
jgi:large subunit ribosomal protein L18